MEQNYKALEVFETTIHKFDDWVVGGNFNLIHALGHIDTAQSSLPLADIYPLTKEQLSTVLQSLDRRKTKEKFYIDAKSQASCNEFYLIVYLLYYGKNDDEIKSIIKNWKDKVHPGKIISKFIPEESVSTDGFDPYDLNFQGLYTGIVEFTGKDIEHISDQDYINYAKKVILNVALYQLKRKSSES